MEGRHICQGEPKGLLSGDTVPSPMCDIEACLCLTPHTTNPTTRLYIWKVTLCLPGLAPQFHSFTECRWVLVTRQCWSPLFALSLQERTLSFKMSPGAHHHLDPLAWLRISGISMWTCNEQSKTAAFLNWQLGKWLEEKQLLSFPPGHLSFFFF